MSPLEHALTYATAGLSIIPIRTDAAIIPDKAKGPIHGLSWKPYQSAIADEETIRGWYRRSPQPGVGIIAGYVSQNLEIMDFDDRVAFSVFEGLCEAAGIGNVLASITRVESPRGVHLYYRLMPGTVVPGSTKLAEKQVPTDDGASLKRETVIETRGEGGYAVAPGTPGYCHPSGLPYTLVNGDLTAISLISNDNWRAMRDIAESMTEFVDEEHPAARPVGAVECGSRDGLRPGDDYANRNEYESLLEKHGWRRIGQRGDTTNWKRPGKEFGLSATSNYGGSGVFYVFSTNAHPFLSRRSYSPFGVYALLEHGGDYKAAATSLGARGYGESPKSKGQEMKRPGSGLSPEQDAAGAKLVEGTKKKEDTGRDDLDLAMSWCDMNADRFAFLEGCQWWSCDGRVWRYSSAESATKSIQDYLTDLWLSGNIGKVTPTMVRNILYLSQSRLGPKSADVFDGRMDWIPCRNGVYDISNGCMIPHHPANNINRISDYDYDPDARCYRWLKFLDEVLINEDGSPCVEWIDSLQLWAGYCLTPDTRLQTSMVWIGEGSNGKGVATRVLSRMVSNSSVVSIPIEQLHDPYHRADLQGKLLGLVNEPDPKAMQKNGNWFKAIVGGDQPISARRPTEKVFNFLPVCRIVLSTNEMPKTRDLSHGYFRRLIIMEFRRNFTTPDTMLDETLEAEASGIFNWALVGLNRLRADRTLKIAPEASRLLLEEYKHGEDNITRFMEEHYEKGSCADDRIPAAEIYKKYRGWCEENGEYCGRGDVFGKRLHKMGFPSKNYRMVKADGNSGVVKCRYPIRVAGDGPEPVITDEEESPL